MLMLTACFIASTLPGAAGSQLDVVSLDVLCSHRMSSYAQPETLWFLLGLLVLIDVIEYVVVS